MEDADRGAVDFSDETVSLKLEEEKIPIDVTKLEV